MTGEGPDRVQFDPGAIFFMHILKFSNPFNPFNFYPVSFVFYLVSFIFGKCFLKC